MSHDHPPLVQTRRDRVFFVLTGFFVTNALIAEIIGGKLFEVPGLDLGLFALPQVVLSIGIVLWPVVFVTTDLLNEYYGVTAVRRLSFLTVALVAYAFLLLYLAKIVPTSQYSGVSHEQFAAVASQSMWIIAGSIAAFLTSQLVDVLVFRYVRKRTGHRMLWLRATGSTAVSQLIDTFVVQSIGLWLPGVLTWTQFINGAMASYAYKLLIAVAITPVIYGVHHAIDRYLARSERGALEL
jgi:hypothetical protein